MKRQKKSESGLNLILCLNVLHNLCTYWTESSSTSCFPSDDALQMEGMTASRDDFRVILFVGFQTSWANVLIFVF